MTVCIVTDSFPPVTNGIAHFYKYLTDLLLLYGQKVIVLTVDVNASGEDETQTENGFTRVTLKRSYQDFYRQYKAYFRPGGHDAAHWLAIGFAARQWLQANAKPFAIDVLELSDYGGLGAFFTGENFPPYLLTAHSSLHQLLPFNHHPETEHIRVVKHLEAAAFAGSTGFIAHSPSNQQAVEKSFGKKAWFARAPWQPPQGFERSTNGLPVTIAGLQTVKGSIFLAEALQACDKQNYPVETRWIGYDTYTAPGGERMSSYLAEQFPAVWKRRLHWEGRQSYADAMTAMAAAPFAIIPSLWETFNYTALEAAALGKAAILTRKTGASYLFTHRQNAWLIDAGDTDALTDGLVRLTQDAELCQRLGAAAKKTVDDYFVPQLAYEERMKIYEHTIGQPRQQTAKNSLAFLDQYTTASRKFYFATRAILKKVLKPGSAS